jgi:hypothetical protein
MQLDEAIAHLLRDHVLVRWDSIGARSFSEAQEKMEAARIAWEKEGKPTFPVWVALKYRNGTCFGPFLTENGKERPWAPTVSDWFSRAWVLVDREHCCTTPPRKWWQFSRRES